METFEELLRAWSNAEARSDGAALDPLLAFDFRGDGPQGLVLDKERWLDCFRRGELAAGPFVWAPARVRAINQTVVAIGLQSRVVRYRGACSNGAAICTLVAVRRNGRWTVVNLQLGTRAQ